MTDPAAEARDLIAEHRAARLAARDNPEARALDAAADAETLAEVATAAAAVAEAVATLKAAADALIVDAAPMGPSIRIHILNLEVMAGNVGTIAGQLIEASSTFMQQHAANLAAAEKG